MMTAISSAIPITVTTSTTICSLVRTGPSALVVGPKAAYANPRERKFARSKGESVELCDPYGRPSWGEGDSERGFPARLKA